VTALYNAMQAILHVSSKMKAHCQLYSESLKQRIEC